MMETTPTPGVVQVLLDLFVLFIFVCGFYVVRTAIKKIKEENKKIETNR